MENISFEVNINDKKWLIMGIYKAPSMSDNDFSTYFIKNIDECIRYYENIILTSIGYVLLLLGLNFTFHSN
jgi:hypothetical protein